MKAVTTLLVILSLALPIQVPPRMAAHIVTAAVGRPDLADDLIAICRRESRCQAIGAHSGDAHISPREYWGQVRLGHLNRTCQPYVPNGWATRGAFGLSAGAHWKYMPLCYRPEWFDYPLVSAAISLKKYLGCEARRHHRGWCRTPTAVRKNNIRRRTRRQAS